MSHPDQVKPVPDADMVPVPVSGSVRVEHDVPTTPRAADFGAWTTYVLAATTTAQPVLPYDANRARAVIIVSGTGPVYVGTKAQAQASPVLGGLLPTGSVVETKNKQALFLAPDGTHTATVTVLVERWGDEMPVAASYTEQLPHSGSAEVLFTGMFDEPAGTIARTVPRYLCTQGGLTVNTTGTPNARLIPLPAGLVVSNIAVCSGSTAEVTGSHFWVGLADLLGNVLAVSADQTGSTYVTASTFLKNPVTIPYLVPQTGLYYLVASISASTMPTLAGSAGVSSSALAGVAPLLSGTFPTQAAPPAVGANLGTLTAGNPNNLGFWIS